MTVETKIFDNDDGRHCLTIMDASEQSYEIFDEHELQGGGYTWEGIVHALIRTNMPEAAQNLDIGAEADNAYVYSASEAPLATLQKLILKADGDSEFLRFAIANADENLE